MRAATSTLLPTDRLRSTPSGAGKRRWNIGLIDSIACPWWRAETSNGMPRRFASFEAAERFRVKMERDLPEGWRCTSKSGSKPKHTPRTRAELEAMVFTPMLSDGR